MLTNDQLIAAIELSSQLTPLIPGQLMQFDLPGVTGRYTHFSHPIANSVSATGLTKENVEETIRAVKKFFFDRNLAFSWEITSRSTPSDLCQRLSQAGFNRMSEQAGLALTDIASPFPHDPNVFVREANEADRDTIIRVGMEGFDLPEDVGALFTDSYLNPGMLRVRIYLAYAEGRDTPGAFAAAVYIPDMPIVSLAGAATLPAQRGKGLYSALVARRLADAHQEGIQAAIIHAVRTTSAPILQKRGFAELCGLELWSASPNESGTVSE